MPTNRISTPFFAWIAASGVWPRITGDLAAQLGLRLEGDAESNLARLQDFCAARRFLIVLRDLRNAGLRVRRTHFDAAGFRRGNRAGRRIDPRYTTRTAASGRGVDRILAVWRAWAAASPATPDASRSATKSCSAGMRPPKWLAIARFWTNPPASWSGFSIRGTAPRKPVDLDYRRACEFDEQMLLPFNPR